MKKLNKNFSIWWGPPKDFNTDHAERKVSWLELFYDLVYVIAIARITHNLSHHLNAEGFFEYICLFPLIFWGWLNGSLYHDLHGNQGLRTRLMTLWQMMIVAALAITLNKAHENYKNVILVFMLMQLFITYQWGSVGFYDRSHRKYSRPYVILYLISFCLMGISLLVPHSWLKFIVPVIFICNYAPPFISHSLLIRSSKSLDLSSSMFERLGLFTIIIFGELVLGVVNGISEIEALSFTDWLNFAIAISVVFALWWIFFTFVSSREVKKGFDKASLLELLYIPALISLGFIAAALPALFIENEFSNNLQKLFCFGAAAFLCCIFFIMDLLIYPQVFDSLKRPMRLSLLITAAIFVIPALINLQLSITYYLAVVEVILIIEIIYLNYKYYKKLLKEGIDPMEI
jgi:low temperature requirement protein LtrA